MLSTDAAKAKPAVTDATPEFEVYERPIGPDEPPKSRGLRGGRLSAPGLPPSIKPLSPVARADPAPGATAAPATHSGSAPAASPPPPATLRTLSPPTPAYPGSRTPFAAPAVERTVPQQVVIAATTTEFEEYHRPSPPEAPVARAPMPAAPAPPAPTLAPFVSLQAAEPVPSAEHVASHEPPASKAISQEAHATGPEAEPARAPHVAPHVALPSHDTPLHEIPVPGFVPEPVRIPMVPPRPARVVLDDRHEVVVPRPEPLWSAQAPVAADPPATHRFLASPPIATAPVPTWAVKPAAPATLPVQEAASMAAPATVPFVPPAPVAATPVPATAPLPPPQSSPVFAQAGPAVSPPALQASSAGPHGARAPTAPASPPTPTPAPRPHLPDAPLATGGDVPRLAFVQADFNQDLTDPMAEAALRHAKALGCVVKAHVHVPGVFETPLAAQTLAQREDVDAVVVIACVIQGETGHNEVITHAAAKAILEVSLATGKPVAFGVTGPRMTRAQAEARIVHGKHAVDAAVKAWRVQHAAT